MCGFAGVFDSHGIKEYDIDKMIRLIRHRGPNEQKIEMADKVFQIGFARLAIIDLKGGSQPMHSGDGGITVLCNGEIYNYRELKKKLAVMGVAFDTSGDVEVLLRMYECYGIDMVEQIQGMYGAVIIDRKRREIFLLRDRLGIKPVYYSYKKEGLCAFASEIKCLLELPFVSKDIDREAVAQFLSYEYVLAPRTIFSDIKKVLPGQYIRLTDHSFETITYWDCKATGEEEEIGEKGAKRKVIELLRESMELHLRSDVPLGFFLSGGIDSGLITALAREQLQRLNTYTLRFEDNEFDETGLAGLVAQRYGTDHHCFTVKADDFKRLIPEMLWYFDEPLGDSGILPNYMLNQLVSKEGIKVVLSGAGGDELFGGYGYYFQNPKERFINSVPVISKAAGKLLEGRRPDISGRIKRALAYKKAPFEHMLLCETIHEKTFVEHILEERGEEEDVKRRYYESCSLDGLNRLLYVDIKTYLTDDLMLLSDRSCMAHSVEGRVPFLHHPLVEYSMKIPQGVKAPRGQRKWLLKEIAKEYLPEELFHAPKMGFYSPIQRWQKSGLGEFTYSVLNSERSMERGIWNRDFYSKYVSDKINYKNSYGRMYLFLILELYFRVHIDHQFADISEIIPEDIYGH